MTARLPPLIKPDRRFSRIRLSEFHFSVAIFQLLVSAVRRVRGFGRVCNRATVDISPCVPVLSPQPLPEPIGVEAIHLPEDSVIVCQSKIVAPAAGHSVDFIDKGLFALPGARSPRRVAFGRP